MIDSFFPGTLVPGGGTSFLNASGLIFRKFEFNRKEVQSKCFSSSVYLTL